jgi:hypothetical protein
MYIFWVHVQARSRTYEPGSVCIERVEKSMLMEELFNDVSSKRICSLVSLRGGGSPQLNGHRYGRANIAEYQPEKSKSQ